MEVQIPHVMPFGNNGDIKQFKNGSARRRSHTRESTYCDVQSEPITRMSSSQFMPNSYTHNTTFDDNLSCGVIPHELQSRLLDPKDYKSRTHAIEELKYLVQGYNFTSLSHSNIVGFIRFLCRLLDDSNFTVVLITLDVLYCFVIKLGQDIKDFLKPVIAATVKLLGDGKITVKQEYMKIYMNLMKVTGPSNVLTVLLENLKHKNSRVREEVVNICIVSLLTYPSEDFNLPLLACEIAPCLIDTKRRVRHAALEAFAVMAASMGPGKSSLLKAVDVVELQENGEGLMNAVQARLARKTLPRVSPNGLVEYALPFPSSAQIRGTSHLPGADTDWLLTGTRIQSRTSHDTGHNGREIVPHIDPVARRMLSAVKGKNKFPWESEDPGVLDAFPGSATSDKLPSTTDVSHTPVVRTPSAKGRTSSTSQAPAKYDNHSETLPAFFDSNNAPVTLNASIARLPTGHKDLNRSKPVPPISKGAKSAELLEKTSDKENFVIDHLVIKDEDVRGELPSTIDVHHTPILKTQSAKTRNSTSQAPPKYSKRAETLSAFSDKDKVSIPLEGSVKRQPSGLKDLNRSKPVPPITKGVKPPEINPSKDPIIWKNSQLSRNSDVESTSNDILDFSDGEVDDREEMKSSLRNLRNSAAKKRETITSLSTPSPTDDGYSESGVYSRESLTSPMSPTPQPKRASHMTSIPIPKSRLGILPSTHAVKNPVNPANEKAVTVIGQRMSHKIGEGFDQEESPEETVSAAVKGLQKPSRPMKGITGSVTNFQKMNHHDGDVVNPLLEDTVAIIGKAWRPGSDSSEPADIKPATLKRTSSIKTLARRNAHQGRSSAAGPSESTDPSVLRELPRPQRALTDAVAMLSDDDWEKKIEGLNLVRRLSACHPDVIFDRLHDIKIAVTQEVKNLRSTVSRVAIACLGDMFSYLKKDMDYELDHCVRVLLSKAGESSVFIREDVDKALDSMVQNVTPVRALNALINGGASHLNTAVKKCTAQHLCNLIMKSGPAWILSGVKDVTDRAVPTITKFAQDGSQETRFYGRKMLHILSTHPNFKKMLDKYVPHNELPYIRDVIVQIQTKGLGEILDTPSARGRRCRQSESFDCLPKDSYCL